MQTLQSSTEAAAFAAAASMVCRRARTLHARSDAPPPLSLPRPLPSPHPAADTTFWLHTYLVNSTDGTWSQQGEPAVIPYDGSGPWELPRDLYAGTYRFALFGRNVNGDGPDSDLTDPVAVGERGCWWQECVLHGKGCSGCAAAARCMQGE